METRQFGSICQVSGLYLPGSAKRAQMMLYTNKYSKSIITTPGRAAHCLCLAYTLPLPPSLLGDLPLSCEQFTFQATVLCISSLLCSCRGAQRKRKNSNNLE